MHIRKITYVIMLLELKQAILPRTHHELIKYSISTVVVFKMKQIN